MSNNFVEKYLGVVEAQKKGELVSRTGRPLMTEALSSPDLSAVLHQAIIDVVKDTAEPMYLASKFFKPVQITEGRSIIFPRMSDIVASEVGELSSYPEVTAEVDAMESETEISVKKIGCLVRVSDEQIADSQWDVIGLLLQKAGSAMARYKEEWCFREMTRHGHVVFDPEHADVNFHTHGLGQDRVTPNNTLSVEDFIDLLIGNLANGFQTTDILMHPLVWPIFAKNPLLDKLSVAAMGGANNQVTITPEAVQGKLPFAVNIQLSPFCNFNYVDKKYDMFIIDRNNVGVLVVKEGLMTENWDTPAQDLKSIKFRERYAPGVLRGGRGISVAKNINFALTYPEPDVVKMID